MEVWTDLGGTMAVGMLLLAAGKYMINTLVVGLRTRVEELEKHLHEAEGRIHKLEEYIIHDLKQPLPNGH